MPSRSTVVFLLRFAGIGLLIGAVTWLFTGDIDQPYHSLHVTGGWRGIVVAIVGAALALIGAQYVARRGGPSA